MNLVHTHWNSSGVEVDDVAQMDWDAYQGMVKQSFYFGMCYYGSHSEHCITQFLPLRNVNPD